MALIRYEPLNLLNQLQREVNRLFDTSRFGDEETGHTGGGKKRLHMVIVEISVVNANKYFI